MDALDVLEAGWSEMVRQPAFFLHVQDSPVAAICQGCKVCSFRGQVQLLERQIKLAEALCCLCMLRFLEA